MGLNGTIVVDGTDEYGLLGQMRIVKSKDGVTYKPHMEIKRPGYKDISLEGTVDVQGKKKAKFDLSLHGVTSQSISTTGMFIITK